MLGKRKREVAAPARCTARSHDAESATETACITDHDLFRRHFESVFESLPGSQTATPAPEEHEYQIDPADEDSAWEGISDSEQKQAWEAVVIEVVELRKEAEVVEDAESQRQRYKSFMVRGSNQWPSVRARVDPLR